MSARGWVHVLLFILFMLVVLGIYYALCFAEEIQWQRARYLAQCVRCGDADDREQAVRECAEKPHLEKRMLAVLREKHNPAKQTDGVPLEGWRAKQLVDMHRWCLRDYYATKQRLHLRESHEPLPSDFKD